MGTHRKESSKKGSRRESIARAALRRVWDRVAFLTLYVREAHPGDHYPQPQTFEEKLAHARAYQARDQIPWPVVVDDITGSLHQALDARPEAAYLMDTDGTVAFCTLWATHEWVLRRALKAFVSGQPSPLGENQEKLIPMLKGMGVMYEILGFAGKPARRDVAREVPPMYGIVRLAALFRPLPPLGRSLAAITIALVGMLVLITSLRRLVTKES